MTNIKVRDIISEDTVCVVVNGYCNHADVVVEPVDFGHADQRLGDWVDGWQDMEVCNRCGAIFSGTEWVEN